VIFSVLPPLQGFCFFVPKSGFMQIVVLTNEMLKKEMLEKDIPTGVNFVWVAALHELLDEDGDIYFDLLFEKNDERIRGLATLLPKPVFVNAVTHTLSELGQPFIRVNAWPGFLQRKIIEIAVNSHAQHNIAASILSSLGWEFTVVPDEPGMITGRVISMLVNEAYFALGEEVSTKKEIDIAMKLGTNYPLGPFEWSERIGLANIYSLLSKLGESDRRYLVADVMTKEVNQAHPYLFSQ
jgi:3-hydroxybutyryl-CoA dehydrogenase